MSKPRHELKFFINVSDYFAIKNRIKHIAFIDKNADSYGSYHIRSLYFDNFNDKALLEKINGYSRREKFRIRYYNDNFDFIRLEKKSKVNGLCTKFSAPLTKEQCEKILNNDINWMLNSDKSLIQELYFKMKSQMLRPKTVVDYTREAYIYKPGNVRITIDSNVRTGICSQDMFNTALPTMKIPNNDTIILEVKFDEFLPDIIKDTIQTNTRKAASISKYASSRMFG
ncbi:polyphosphate polymerase domain-containing protein [uncultured Clostridium sp.]|uniref:polyphosphate polymerase domain-containing protein n=1 Tax=uncultured Clostridium sp. TaxID=59620 RepID=UPI0025DC0B1B|nr:polyphosphate polymerase domain-containing protein [uncultured Clostridium sp.]MDU4882639.1 polyphosphate polymerase domain-containing protein [Clostridium celatum]MDU7077355.1 polyphosphate polymerase domain-containing protein [Clostridium celatum]